MLTSSTVTGGCLGVRLEFRSNRVGTRLKWKLMDWVRKINSSLAKKMILLWIPVKLEKVGYLLKEIKTESIRKLSNFNF